MLKPCFYNLQIVKNLWSADCELNNIFVFPCPHGSYGHVISILFNRNHKTVLIIIIIIYLSTPLIVRISELISEPPDEKKLWV